MFVKWLSASGNEEYFVNVASGGFGVQVTSATPVALKNFLGGDAYTLSGPEAQKHVLPHDCPMTV